MPPLGVFMSEFLVVSSTFARAPLLAIPLVFGLLVAFGALMLKVHGLAFGKPVGVSHPVKASYLPMVAHLGLVLIAGLYLPPPMVAKSEEHTSELQSLMRISYAVFCLQKKTKQI